MTHRSDETNFFVYGTLKRRECREMMWPRTPIVVEEAWVLGELYDAGAYPALVAGNDKVLGELWTFPSRDFEAIVRVLDEIEEYRANDPFSLYNRELIDCETISGRRTTAHTYLYARLKDLPLFKRLLADDGDEFTSWRSA